LIKVCSIYNSEYLFIGTKKFAFEQIRDYDYLEMLSKIPNIDKSKNRNNVTANFRYNLYNAKKTKVIKLFYDCLKETENNLLNTHMDDFFRQYYLNENFFLASEVKIFKLRVLQNWN
jgi:hypothetical protein